MGSIEKNREYHYDYGNGHDVTKVSPHGVTNRFADTAMWILNLKKII